MISVLTLVSIHFGLKVGGVPYQGKKLGLEGTQSRAGVSQKSASSVCISGPGAKGPCRKMMRLHLHSGDPVLTCSVLGPLGATPESHAEEWASVTGETHLSGRSP